MLASHIETDVAQRGFAHCKGLSGLPEYRAVASALGETVGEEIIELRDGAHAYVAKPGEVPLHTDHPQVEIVMWFCLEQDADDGASRLLDARPTLENYSRDGRELLRRVDVWCPPVAGGPPTQRFPILRRSPRKPERDLLFCSPWLEAAAPLPGHQVALDNLRRTLAESSKTDTTEIRLEAGDVLIVDNQRVLHGRGAIHERSRRRLHRLWLITKETAALE